MGKIFNRKISYWEKFKKNGTHKFPVSFWPRQKSAKNGAVKERSHKRRKYTIEVFLEFFRILNKHLIMFLKPFLWNSPELLIMCHSHRMNCRSCRGQVLKIFSNFIHSNKIWIVKIIHIKLMLYKVAFKNHAEENYI